MRGEPYSNQSGLAVGSDYDELTPKRPVAGPWPWPNHRPPPYEVEPPPAETSAMASLVELLGVMRRRWPIVATTVALALVLGVLVLTLVPRQWRGEVSLLLHPTGPEVLDTVDGVEERLDGHGYAHYYQTQRQVISSRTIAAAALAELGLDDDPAFLGIAGIDDPLRQAEAAAEIDPVERLRELIDVREVHDSRVVQIRVEYPDAEIAAEIANAVAQVYLDYINGERLGNGVRAKDDLEGELGDARTELRAAELALAEFKLGNGITTIALEDRQSVVTNEILELDDLVQAAQAARISAEDMYGEAKRLFARGAYSAVASMLGPGERKVFDDLTSAKVEAQGEFKSLDLRYGDKHPSWIEAEARHEILADAIAREAKGHLSAFEARYAAAKSTERKLEVELGRAQARALELSRLEPEYKSLARAVKDAEEVYQVLARRVSEIDLTNRVEGQSPVKILDLATVPTDPVRPRVALGLALALALGLVLGGLAAVTIDSRDLRIRDIHDLERAVAGWDLPVLGQLPTLAPDPQLGGAKLRDQRRQRDLYTHRFPQSAMAERVRSVRAAIGFSLGHHERPIIMITSPASAEGKSSLALNLALSWCQTGKRVVLVDADLRRPRLHEVFGLPELGDDAGEVGEHGLVSVLEGRCELDDALVRAPTGAPAELSILPRGPHVETPAELVDGPASRRVLAGLRERFDVVILDTPPLLPVVDALLLARLADGVVLVSRSRSSSRADVQRSLTLLRQRDTNLLGLVLNDVEAEREHGGHYGYATYTSTPTEGA